MKNRQLKIKQGEEINTVQAVETAGKGELSTRDWLIGLLMAVGTPVIATLYDLLMTWLSYEPVVIEWRTIVKMGLSAGALYIGKNLFDGRKIFIKAKELEK